MRRIKGKDANMRFLFGSVFFFFVIIITIVLFGYFSLQQYWSTPQHTSHSYEIVFSQHFDGLDYDVYMNDSLLYSGTPVDADTVISVVRFANENSLLVVDRKTDIVSILEISKQYGRLKLRFENNEIRLDVD